MQKNSANRVLFTSKWIRFLTNLFIRKIKRGRPFMPPSSSKHTIYYSTIILWVDVSLPTFTV